jgi:hypothetical protein
VSAVTFSDLRGVPGTYEVRRDGVLLGCVSEVEHVVTTRRTAQVRIRKVRRWRFQLLGADTCRVLYPKRKDAAAGLATWFDAHQSARKTTEST